MLYFFKLLKQMNLLQSVYSMGHFLVDNHQGHNSLQVQLPEI